MPCCCVSNIKAAFVIGIILAVFYALQIISLFKDGETFYIITGFLGLVSALILAYGAHTRNRKAMLIYIGSAILKITLFMVLALLEVVKIFNADFEEKIKEICRDKSGLVKFMQGSSLYEMCFDGAIWNGVQEGVSKDLIRTCNRVRLEYQVCSDGAWILVMITYIFFLLIIVGGVIFNIWTIIIAKNAKKVCTTKKQWNLDNRTSSVSIILFEGGQKDQSSK